MRALLWVLAMNYFTPGMTAQELNKISMLGLAHVGDAVYELMTRTTLCAQGHSAAMDLHKLTVSHVNAPAQAKAVERILPLMTEAEQAVYKRGRNAHVHSVPQRASVGEYHAATGLEALFGWLYLQGMQERLQELFDVIREAWD